MALNNSSGPASLTVAPPGSRALAHRQPHPGDARLRILVLVHNELIRCGLATMLATLPMVERFHVAEEIDEAWQMLCTGGYDVAILPCDDSVGALDLRAVRPHTRVLLLLLNEADHQHLDCAARNVCDGFLLLNELTALSLHNSLARLIQGELPMPSGLARELLSQVRRSDTPRPARPIMLTPRERQVLALIVEGLSNKQVARRLGISEHGAKRHVATVLAKLNCPNRALAVAIALREGLVAES